MVLVKRKIMTAHPHPCLNSIVVVGGPLLDAARLLDIMEQHPLAVDELLTLRDDRQAYVAFLTAGSNCEFVRRAANLDELHWRVLPDLCRLANAIAGPNFSILPELDDEDLARSIESTVNRSSTSWLTARDEALPEEAFLLGSQNIREVERLRTQLTEEWRRTPGGENHHANIVLIAQSDGDLVIVGQRPSGELRKFTVRNGFWRRPVAGESGIRAAA